MATRRVSVSVTGVKELRDQLGRIVNDVAGDGRKAGVEFKEVLRDAAELIAVAARRNNRDISGDLDRAIFASRGDPAKPSAIVGVNHKIAFYGRLVEFGHAGPHEARARPFMRPAVETEKPNVRRIIYDGLARIVRKYTK